MSSKASDSNNVYDYVIIGSGFGGSVAAMRLTEKGYRVLVLERGKRFRDEDFPKSNWNIFKFLWTPILRCFGYMQLTLLNDVLILHGSGVGGGSLVYAGVLLEPDEKLFNTPGWQELADWQTLLRPHYDTAKKMLGAATNPRMTPADEVLKAIAAERGQEHTFRMTNVSVFFGDPDKEGETVPDPYFNGEGPDRAGCIHCGGCMVGCRYNAKNTLVKNYLYFAEKGGTEIRPEAIVCNIEPLDNQTDGARYQISHKNTTSWVPYPLQTPDTVRARNVIVSAGALGTLKLLFDCRDVKGTLPRISQHLGENARTNSEAILGSVSRTREVDYSQGVAITSAIALDEVTHVEPVRYPEGSGFIRTITAPMVEGSQNPFVRFLKAIWASIIHPINLMHAWIFSGWAVKATILLIMQTTNNTFRLRGGRHVFNFFRRGLISELKGQPITPDEHISQGLVKDFAARTNGIPVDSIPETLFKIPTTAHIMGGCPMGKSDADGVVGTNCEVFNYPGLYVIDGSIMPGNPGVNPSLSITALAEYAMSQIPPAETGGNGVNNGVQAESAGQKSNPVSAMPTH